MPFDWPDNDPAPGLDSTLLAPFPDIPAEMPGVGFARNIAGVHPDHNHTPHPTDNHEPDWATAADKARYNANLDATTALPPAPEIIDVDNYDNESPLPSSLRQTLQYLPKIDPDQPLCVTPESAVSTSSRYPTRTRAPPKRYGFDDFHVFTTMAEESADDRYLYTNANGKVVDLAITDEVLMAHVCQYVMLHTADKLYANATDSPTKKHTVSKWGSRNLENEEVQLL